MPLTQIADVIVPEIFDPYVQQLTEEKSRLISSGALVRDGQLDANLVGGGSTFNTPSFKDLENIADNVSGDADDDSHTGGSANSAPQKTSTSNEVQVRLSRNQSWSSADLAGALAGADPMQSIANRLSTYWARRLQAAFVATMNGVFADNDAAPTGGEHVQGDLTNDISGDAGGGYEEGVTDFGSEAFIDATVTMGDSMGNLTMVAVHSIVYARMQKLNLIDYIPDARGEVSIPTYLGRTVIVDDGITNAGGVFETWLFGSGASLLGMGAPKVPSEVERKPGAGNGGGQEVIHNRTEWIIHPAGHRFNAAASGGGPSNASTVGNLAHEDSWFRVYPERKQIAIARLITREF